MSVEFPLPPMSDPNEPEIEVELSPAFRQQTPKPVADEPTAIRRAYLDGYIRSLFHRPDDLGGHPWTACGGYLHPTAVRVPLSQTAPEDRCKTCWPTH